MFKGTREKLEEKYIRPAENKITLSVILSVLAFIMAIVALAIPRGI